MWKPSARWALAPRGRVAHRWDICRCATCLKLSTSLWWRRCGNELQLLSDLRPPGKATRCKKCERGEAMKPSAEERLLAWLATRLPAKYPMRIVDRLLRAVLRGAADRAASVCLTDETAAAVRAAILRGLK